jgi:uncharacterized protein
MGMMRVQLLEPNKVDRVLLTYSVGAHEGHRNPHAVPALCRASNEWCTDVWLNSGDPRFYSLVCVHSGLPDEAAKEIRRAGAHERMAGVLMFANPLRMPMGHPIFDPIYDAASEMGLPIVIHLSGEVLEGPTAFAGGLPSSKVEYFSLLEQAAMHHLSSLLVSGTFERFPKLRVLFNEYGFTWAPWVVWNLDARWPEIQKENHFIRRLPSEYLPDHVWFSTQPCDPESPEALIEMLEAFGGMEDRLCFASDYPHWDADTPAYVLARFPKEWRSKIACENAARLFGWPSESKPAIDREDLGEPKAVAA